MTLPPPPENKSRKSGVLFVSKKRPSTDHVYHAFHHNLTAKTPPQPLTFFKNPAKNAEIHPGGAQEKISEL